MSRAERVGRMKQSSARNTGQGTGMTLESWECDEPKCKFKFGPLSLEQAAVLRRAHLKSHGRKP